LAERVKRLTRCPGEIVFRPLHYVDVEVRSPNVSKARELLGFEAKVDIDEGPQERAPAAACAGAPASPPVGRVLPRKTARNDLIRLAWPDVGAEEAEAVAEVLETGILTMGPKVAEFEAELARACRVAHAVAVSSGTAALHLAVRPLGTEPGDELIAPAHTFP